MSPTAQLAFAAAALAVLATGGAAWAEPVVVPLDIELTTTSDRVRLRWQGLSTLRTQRSIEVGGPVHLRVTGLSMQKPALDRTPLKWSGRVLAVLKDEAPAVELDQGAVGQTRLRIRSGHKLLLDVSRKPPAGPRRVALDASALRGLRPAPRRAHERLVLAFYYGWWGRADGPSKRWRHWRPWRPGMGVVHKPTLGYYDSLDRAAVAEHIEQAKGAGIDGFILSWWGEKGDDPRVLQLLLEEANKRGFRISIYIERGRERARLHKRLAWIIDRFGGHPAFLRADDRPVIMFYDPVHRAIDRHNMRHVLEGLRGFFVAGQSDGRHLARLDAMHVYYIARDPEGHVRSLRTTSAAARLRDAPVIATVTPGYDDRAERKPGFHRPRAGGATYDRLWRGAWAADWVLLVSWNEWHEGSQLEPSNEFGSRYLELTRRHRERWLGQVVGLPLAVTMLQPDKPCKRASKTSKASKCPPPWRLPVPVHNRSLAHRVGKLLQQVLEAAATAGERPFFVRRVLPLQKWAVPWRSAKGALVRRTSAVMVVLQQAEQAGCMAVRMVLEEPQTGPRATRRARLRVQGFGRPVACK